MLTRTHPEDVSNLPAVRQDTGSGGTPAGAPQAPGEKPPRSAPSRDAILSLGVAAVWLVVIGLLGLSLLASSIARSVLPEVVALSVNGRTFAVLGVMLGPPLLLLLIEWRKFKHLESFCELRDAYRAIDERGADSEGVEPRREQIDRLLAHWYSSGSPSLRDAVGEARGELRKNDGALQWRAAVEKHVLTELDRQADAEIRRAAILVASATAVIPNRSLDALATLWINLRLTRRLLDIYQVRTGTWGTLRVGARTVESIVFGDIADSALTDAVGQLRLPDWFAPVGKGALSACLSIRVGRAVRRECRPFPIPADQEISVLADMMRAVADTVKERWVSKE